MVVERPFPGRNDFIKTLPLVIIVSNIRNSLLGVAGNLFGFYLFSIEHVEFKRSRGATVDPNNFSPMVIFILPLIVLGFF